MAKPKRASARQDSQSVRCAIYTRKSTEEGLEQEFNSLDAQREACAAYILSQRHEGWVLLPTMYDDGGFSGGNMDRPGLKQLLADVESGKVDVIVLYKVDRLTRSLADFARIVEVLDGAGASFVSVTQSFNTTTSMGRLTLNVLLSFAQFEREVTGERIRDKVAASKAKGMWMGGVVPLGYNVESRKLVIDEVQAASVRTIFRLYTELKSTGELSDELHGRGITTRARTLSSGAHYGGGRFSRGALATMLQNRVYIGEVEHREQVYAGEHQPIIERELWDRVQGLLAANRRERRTLSRRTETSLLTGMVHDGLGRRMSPTHATKGTRRYRYYVSREEEALADHRLWRLPAHALEQLVIERLGAAIGGGDILIDRLPAASGDTTELVRQRCWKLAERLSAGTPTEARSILEGLSVEAHLQDERITIGVDAGSLLTMTLGSEVQVLALQLQDTSRIMITVPVAIRRRGQELRLVHQPSGPVPGEVDATLVALIARAHQARGTLMERNEQVSDAERPHLTRLARLSYLAPDLQAAILAGRQPPQLSARQLLRTDRLPVCWRMQRQALGFAGLA
ncbi:MAG TPA: recombinase family protein [Allosphingosinicella sp.]|nr:recombinase family protein [Allosphingosinicella sp.]